MNKDNYAVIMAGGVGHRFWPMSTEEAPKQFLDVLGLGKTLIQLTYERLRNVVSPENIFVITNESYVEIVKHQLPEINESQILSEPVRKNTAPCITYAAAKIYTQNKNAVLVVAPSDHLILKEYRFAKIINAALRRASEDESLITIGIKPNRPDTGYGYIKFQQEGDILPGQISKVLQFTEKPNRELAELFLNNGNYYWNSGIFIWKADVILKAIQKFQPDLYDSFCSNLEAYNTANESQYISEAFRQCENISIDFAVMENSKNVEVILADFDWSDIGTWGSIYGHLDKDVSGNSIKGKNTHVFNSSNCLINLPDDKLAIIQGLNNHIVVETKSGLLILDKKDEQNLKVYLEAIQNSMFN